MDLKNPRNHKKMGPFLFVRFRDMSKERGLYMKMGLLFDLFPFQFFFLFGSVLGVRYLSIIVMSVFVIKALLPHEYKVFT